MKGIEDSVKALLSGKSDWRALLRLADWLPWGFIFPRPMAAMRLERMALASAIWSSLSVQTSFRCSICDVISEGVHW
jgi:hypothetical protein